MNVTCPNCATIYRVDPAKVPEGGVRARCSVCSAVFAVKREGEEVLSPPRPAAKGTGPTAASMPQPVAEAPRPPAPPSLSPRPAAPAAAGPAGSPPRPGAPQKAAAGDACQPGRSSLGSRARTAHAGSSRYQSGALEPARAGGPPAVCASSGCHAGPNGTAGSAQAGNTSARPISRFSATAIVSGAGGCPAAESISLSGPGAQGKAVGPGADLRYGRVSSGQAAGGTSRRKSEGTVRGGDQKELGGVRGTGGARDCRFHRIFPGGVERDSGGWAANFLTTSASH